MKEAMQAIAEKVGGEVPLLTHTESGKTVPRDVVEHWPMLFVYGTLKVGSQVHERLLGKSIYVGEAAINGILLYGPSFPWLISHPHCVVHGEVYKLSLNMLRDCDNYENAPNMFQRRQVKTAYGKAWSYFMTEPPPIGLETRVVKAGTWQVDGRTESVTFSEHLASLHKKLRTEMLEGGDKKEEHEPKKIITLPDKPKEQEEKPKTKDPQIGPGFEMYDAKQ